MAEQRYKIYEQLGAGGNGAVFRAYDTQLKRWVAIKRLLSATEAETNPDAEELRREADTLASLRNANIVTIFDVSTDAEGLFIVMELLEGPDLADTILHGPMTPEDFKQLAEQTLEALLAAHSLRILHRDLKPENIKVERLPGGRFQAKIIDFGLARSGLIARKQTEDQAGSVMGSIYYMAPEQLSREPTDVRTDLYSLGCVFYEALSARKAFDGKSVNDVIDKHLDHDLVPLNQLCPHLPQWLTYWVMRLMACKPAERPQNAQQAIEEFRAWEKLPPAPNMMPWMPTSYGYGGVQGYGHPQGYNPASTVPLYQHTTGHVPVQTGGYYAQPHITSSSVPVLVQPDSSSIPVAIPVATRVAEPGVPKRPVGGSARAVPVKPIAEPANKTKLYAMIGGGVLVLAVVAFMFRGGDTPAPPPPSAPKPTGPQIGAAREDLYPSERAFPIPEYMRVVHYTAKAATRGYQGGKASNQIDSGTIISMWEDVAKRGNNTPLISRDSREDQSPERVRWATADSAVRDDRYALLFKNKSGKPVSMRLYQGDKNKDSFPFGKPSPPSSPGLSMAVVLQADGSRLPCRVLRLGTPDGQNGVTLSVSSSKAFEAEFKTPSGTTKLTSKDVDATRPSLAIMTWNPANDEIQLRTRDFTGKSNQTLGKASSKPSAPLYDLELGGPGPETARQYTGQIADIIVLATMQKDDQTALMDKELREYFFTKLPTPPPAPAPTAPK